MSRQDRTSVLIVGALIIFNALIYFASRDLTYVHIDAIAHVNKARGLFDNLTPGLFQLGSIWLPLQHVIIAPLAWFDVLWATGLAGSIVSALAFVATGYFLFASAWRITGGSKNAGWLAFFLFALNPRLIYLFTTPMGEPLMIAFATGLLYFMLTWTETQRWEPLAWAALMTFCATLTRYEGWAIAAASIPLVFVLARSRRIVTTILYTGAAVTGPLLWMLYNMAYFDDPLMFTYGRGSARDYAQEYFLRTGKTFATAGSWADSFATYLADVAYCVNPIILWVAAAGIVLSAFVLKRNGRRMNAVLLTFAVVPFAFYVYNLYANMIPILLPGLVSNEPESIYNVRYGSIMAASLPIYAGLMLHFLAAISQVRRSFALLFLTPILLPAADPTPEASRESIASQFTANLFYREGIHNQSYWMPPFVEVADKLKSEIDETEDQSSFVLTNTRIVHVVVWRTAIPMKRFVNEMNEDAWVRNLGSIRPEVRWVITEEGDQLWHAQGAWLRENFIEAATAKTPTTGVVHLYRRKDPTTDSRSQPAESRQQD